MIDDVSRNPGLLKLDLYCRGIRIGESCRVAEDGGREIMRTRAGLGSGLEVILPALPHAIALLQEAKGETAAHDYRLS